MTESEIIAVKYLIHEKTGPHTKLMRTLFEEAQREAANNAALAILLFEHLSSVTGVSVKDYRKECEELADGIYATMQSTPFEAYLPKPPDDLRSN